MELMKNYCIKECVEWITSNNYQMVGLEFPDKPHHAVLISQLLKKEIGFSPIVLLDYNRACGNCCVDERTARPRGIDAVIHFGNTCLTETNSLPVLYVLDSSFPFDSERLTETLVSSDEGPTNEEDLILLYDLRCTPFVNSLFLPLKSQFPNIIQTEIIIPERAKLIYNNFNELNFEKLKIDESSNGIFVVHNRKINLPKNKRLEDYNFIFVGDNSPALVSFQMRFSDKTFYTINHIENTFTKANFIKTVMGRSRKIEQVREARTIGILLTLVHNHQEISNRMSKLIKESDKRSYTFFMGKINEAKLGNIVGVDVFVYIGCPESSLFDRNKDGFLYKKIVTPWELEVALNPSFDWTLNFETNFNELLKIKIEEEEKKDDGEKEDQNKERENHNDEIIERKPGTLHKLHERAAGEMVANLSWQGLNPNEESPVPIGTVVEGRKGIAMQYDSEPK